MKPIRILIVDPDLIVARQLAAHIGARGFEVRAVTTGKDARAQILEWTPRFVIADYLMPDANALSLIEFIAENPILRRNLIQVLVTSAHNHAANVRTALKFGALDYIVKPFDMDHILRRMVFHARSYRPRPTPAPSDIASFDDATLMLHLTDLILRQALRAQPLNQILFNLTRMINLRVDGVRCSIIHCVDQEKARVVSSNDAFEASGIELNLNKYPEVLHVLNTQTTVAIENVEQNEELRHIRQHLRDFDFNALIVCPVSRHNQPFGVVSLRLPTDKPTISDNEIRFVEIVAQVISLVLDSEAHKSFGDYWLTSPDGPHLRPLPKIS